jgi:hypothetical protein
MDGSHYASGKPTRPAVKKTMPKAEPASVAGRLRAERRAAAEMTIKIRRRSKAIAASADRLLSRVI